MTTKLITGDLSAATNLQKQADFAALLASTAYVVDSGTANAIVVSVAGATYTTGAYLIIKVAATNTAATTINLNALGTKSLKKITNAGIVDLSVGDIPAGAVIFCVYDGTQYITDVGLTSHLADTMYQTAGGTATAITLTISETLVNGFPITFIASANNNAAATTINAKPLYKPNTTTAPNLIAGKAYTVWYNSTSNCFFIKASAEGNTVAAHVLAGDTFSNDSDTGLVGTMPNKASGTPVTSNWTDGAGNLHSSIPLGAYVTQGAGPAGTEEVYSYDANFIAANILSGKSIFGVAGSAISGTPYAKGTTVASTVNIAFSDRGNAGVTLKYVTVSGLTFTPKIIVLITENIWSYADLVVYDGYANLLYYSASDYAPIFVLNNMGLPNYIRLTGNAYVNSSGFQMPVGNSDGGFSYTWYAYAN